MLWTKERIPTLQPNVIIFFILSYSQITQKNLNVFISAVRKERDLREKFDSLKKVGRLDQYMAKKRKHNTQRDRRRMPFSEDAWCKLSSLLTTNENTQNVMLFLTCALLFFLLILSILHPLSVFFLLRILHIP